MHNPIMASAVIATYGMVALKCVCVEKAFKPFLKAYFGDL